MQKVGIPSRSGYRSSRIQSSSVPATESHLQKKGANRKLGIEYVEIRRLILDPLNPRVHAPKQLGQIARSIAEFGFLVPILADGEGRVIAGHGRIEAAALLGIRSVPVIQVEHLTPTQKRAFIIADNRLAEIAQWNDQLLASQLKDLSAVELDFDLEVTGFEMGEIDLLIAGIEPVSNAQPDPADELPAVNPITVSSAGDLWKLGRHRLFCGNSLDAASYEILMGDQLAAAVITDPPFNVPIDGHVVGLGKIHHRDFAMASGEMSPAEFTRFLTHACELLAAHSADGSIHFIFMDWRHMEEILAAGRAAYSELKSLCVWNKGVGGMGSLYRSQHELVFVFKHGSTPHRNNIQLGQFGRYRTNVWDCPGMNQLGRRTLEGNLLELHPTVKPVSLLADAILDCTARQDVVLDAFAGSGSTIVAAERVGRCCFAIEIDPVYVDTAIRRWQKFTGETAIHASTGRSFGEQEEKVTAAEALIGNGQR